MARFDRTIPAGGQGQVTLKLDLEGYSGKVGKSSVVTSDPPGTGEVVLRMQGRVEPFIEVDPAWIRFFGPEESLTDQEVLLQATDRPFKVLSMENPLEKRVGLVLETLKPGRRYRITAKNLGGEGQFKGTVLVRTDHPEKPEIKVRIHGMVTGNITAQPATLVLTRSKGLTSGSSGKVVVRNAKGEDFIIREVMHNPNRLRVEHSPMEDAAGYVLTITGMFEGVPEDGHVHEVLTVVPGSADKSGAPSDKPVEINVYLLNR